MALQPLYPLCARAMEPLIKRAVEARLALAWPRLVGRPFSTCTMVEKFQTFPEAPGILTVRLWGGLGLDLQHETPKIIERINQYFGHLAVQKLHVRQAPPPIGLATKPVSKMCVAPHDPLPLPHDLSDPLRTTLEGFWSALHTEKI